VPAPTLGGAAKLGADVMRLVEDVKTTTSQPGMTPTLFYFDIIGILWPVRCLLHMKGVEHRLVSFGMEEWVGQGMGLKYEPGVTPQDPTLPFAALKWAFNGGTVPRYVDEHVDLNDSIAIQLYLARKHGMVGDGSMQDELRVLEAMNYAYNSLFHWSGLFTADWKPLHQDEHSWDASAESFTQQQGFGYQGKLLGFRRLLEQNNKGLPKGKDSGFLAGKELTMADLHAYNVLANWFKPYDRDQFVSEFPDLDRYLRRVAAAHEGIADYVRTQQEPTTWFPAPIGPRFKHRLITPEELEGIVELPPQSAPH